MARRSPASSSRLQTSGSQSCVAGEPPGVAQAPVELEDGRVVSAACARAGALTGDVKEITAYGGFAAYRRASG